MIQQAFVRLIEYISTSSQHVMRSYSVLAIQHCIIERKFSKSGAGYQVKFTDIRDKLRTFAPTMLSPVRGNGNTYCYAQANAWRKNTSKKPLDSRCTEYHGAGPKHQATLQKDWVSVFDRSVRRRRVMDGLFSQGTDSYIIDYDMLTCLDKLRVPIRFYLVGQIASKMISLSANFLGKPGPIAANMGSESTASGVVWKAIGLGKSSSRGTGFAKNMLKLNSHGKINCVYCSLSITKFHMDHVMSFYHGGYSCHHAGNLIPSCPGCNAGANGKGAKYLGLKGWIWVKGFYSNNPALVSDIKLDMSSGGSRRQITWGDWWDEVIGFYSDHLAGTTVWNPGLPLSQLSKTELIAIRQILNDIKQI